jgi:hypothetical protein
MDERLHRLKRLTSALATRKRAYELRMAQINNRIAVLTSEHDELMREAAGLYEPFPGANLHYIRRIEVIARQITAQKHDLQQLSLLHLRAGADLRRSEIIGAREEAEALRLQQNRYLEQVIDLSLQRRNG